MRQRLVVIVLVELVHVKPGSIMQRSSQPSIGTRLPSSHSSEDATAPSPQVGLQTLGVPVQPKPGSTAQLALQPSPFSVLPSSQASAPKIAPSPQPETQTLGVLVHV
jgi:hypothetical protein